jgi:two-component system, response regulator FlrC
VTRALVGRTVADVERDLILETLKHCLGNRTQAANSAGASGPHVYILVFGETRRN